MSDAIRYWIANLFMNDSKIQTCISIYVTQFLQQDDYPIINLNNAIQGMYKMEPIDNSFLDMTLLIILKLCRLL